MGDNRALAILAERLFCFIGSKKLITVSTLAHTSPFAPMHRINYISHFMMVLAVMVVVGWAAAVSVYQLSNLAGPAVAFIEASDTASVAHTNPVPLMPNIGVSVLPSAMESAAVLEAALTPQAPAVSLTSVFVPAPAPDLMTQIETANVYLGAANNELFSSYGQVVNAALAAPSIVSFDINTFADTYISGVQSFVATAYELGDESSAVVRNELNVGAVAQAVSALYTTSEK